MYVGNVGDYSGVLGTLFGASQPTLEVWAKYTNAHGGLNGHPVVVISADSGGDPSTDETDVQQMVQQDHVIAMLGPMDVLDYNGSLQYLVGINMPVIGGFLAADEFFDHPNFFPEGASGFDLAEVGIPVAVRQGFKKAAVVYCVETPLCQQGASVLQGSGGSVAKSGGTLVYSAATSLTSPSFTSQCLGAQGAGAQVIELILDAASIERFAQDCAAQNYNPLYETVSLGAVPSLDTVPQLNGLILPSNTFPFTANSTPATQAFQTAMSEDSPATPVGVAASMEWTSGQLLLAGSKDLGTNPTSAQLTAGLDSLKEDTLDGLTVPLTFNAGGDPTIPSCVFVMKIQGGTWTAPNGLTDSCL